MLFWKILFFTSCFVIFYNYLGYALLVYMFNFFNKKQKKETEVYQPGVSFIVAAFNEEDCIETKIINSLEQRYPREKLEYLFITDGSTDRTNEIIKRYPQI
ncbi:MAG: glycosyltransferase, partial [Bacteroidota bacterium]